MKQVEDLTGLIFGKWKVLHRVEDRISNSGKVFDMWLCECLCEKHTIRVIYGDNLRFGKSTSCGCAPVDKRHQKTLETHNTYEQKNGYYIGYTQKKEQFFFDIEDYEIIKNYVWHIGKDGYVVTNNPNWKEKNKHKLIRMHRLVMGISDDSIKIDHKNRKRNDNRKDNLRIATDQENSRNTSKQKDSTYSKYKGVCYHKNGKMWVAYIRINGKRKHLGSFKTELEAAKAYEKAAKKYFGEFACVEPREEETKSVC